MGRIIPSRAGGERLTYTVRVDHALTRIDVELCPSGFRIERLNEPSPGAHSRLTLGIITPQGETACPGEGVDLPLLKADECLNYAVKLVESRADPTSVRRVARDVLASPDAWLWVPSPRPQGLAMRVQFDLPDGVHAAVPWPEVPTELGKGKQFSLTETAFAWKSAGALSHALPSSISLGGAELSVQALGDGFAAATPAVENWLIEGARGASLLYGRFPLERTLVLLVPSDRGGSSFGMALRGGGPAVVIFLDRHVDAARLREDATSWHEFLHLGIPRLPPEDAWLFEGLATYYSELMRARTGRISSRKAYQHLLEGFARGKSQSSSLTLREESQLMHERASYVRVYWAGAALAFLTDIAARRAHRPTLDDALRTFAACCAASEDNWSAARVIEHLDQSLGSALFAEQARRWLDDREFPELDRTLHMLGVTAGQHGEAIFAASAPDAELRDALMAPNQNKAPNQSPPTRPRTRSPTQP